MAEKINFSVLSQPDDSTCGPTCLQAVYQHFGLDIPLEQVIEEVQSLEGGGTVAVFLGLHALKNGFDATIYTYNLQLFDPSWFHKKQVPLRDKITDQLSFKRDRKLKEVSKAYMEFLDNGGRIRFEDLTASLIRRYLKLEIPVLTGLSSTYLYRCPREIVRNNELVFDDLAGEPTGHFIVITGYEKAPNWVWIADPLSPNPASPSQYYGVHINHLVCSIMLGILTYDANLLVIEPRSGENKK